MRLARYDQIRPSKELRNKFDCGEPTLNRWLATQAGQSMATRDAVTHLLLDDEGGDDDEAIAGYYCLSGGEVRREDLPRSQAKGAPQPAPVVRMGRFAIDRRFQGKGWGGDLLREAVLAAVSAVHLIGGRAMLVDAISENAMRFYERYGFEPSPIHPMQLFKDLRVVAASAGLKN